jgi:predicted metalloprotease
MPTKLISTVAALLAAGVLTACGSSASSTTSTSRTSASAAATSTTSVAASTTTVADKALKPPATVHGRTVTDHVTGVSGKKATVGTIKRFRHVRRKSQRAHINGLSGLSLTQKLGVLLNSVASLWQAEFQHSGSQLPPASAVLVSDAPTTCGSTQITSGSAPEYCPANATIDLPLGTITSNIEPLGDAALLLLLSDLYGYHVENAIGAFTHGYSGAQLEKMDSCFSGVYFYYAESEGYLQPTDEQGVNNLLALEAPAAGTSASAGSVTASQLATAFNQGILSNLNPKVCVP